MIIFLIYVMNVLLFMGLLRRLFVFNLFMWIVVMKVFFFYF